MPKLRHEYSHKKGKNKPWLINSLKKACKKKNNLYVSYLRTRTDKDLLKYKKYKNCLTSILRNAEKHYYTEQLLMVKRDVKSTWRFLNNIISKKKKSQNYTGSFIKAGKLTNDKSEVAQGFNDFFVNIGPDLADKIPNCENKDYNDFIKNHIINTIFLDPVTELEVINIVSSFKTKYSCGFDNVSMFVLKKVIHSIIEPLVYNNVSMFVLKKVIHSIIEPLVYNCNKSLETGVFPDQLKIAKVVPIFKSGEKNQYNNYRPVSLLSQFSKILEKAFNNRLMKFVKANKIIYNGQYGFRTNHSTELAVIEMVEKITDAIDNNLYPVGIFIDLKKAFDTINHSILIDKLKNYGIRGIASTWLTSYLSNRKQYVEYNNVKSNIQAVRCGILQGSILGPSLFVLYINDLCNASDLLELILFADDTNIFFKAKDYTQMENTLNRELKTINDWFMVNKLSLNVSKTKFITFGKRFQNLHFEHIY